MGVNLKNMFSKSRDFLTVEIGEKYLKMVHINVFEGRSNVLDTTTMDIGSLSGEDVSSKIRDFARTKRINNAEAINVIPSNFAISKNIEIPSIDKKEIKDIIDLQAGRHTPYSREEIIMDYANIGVFHGRYTKILLVIVKRDIVTKRYDIIKRAGFKANKALLSSEAVSRLCFDRCLDKPKDKPIAVVHIDKVHVDFTVVHQGKMVYIRPISIGMIFTSDKLDEAKMNFLAELKKSIEAYQVENIEAQPSKIYFTGMIGLVSDMRADIEKVTGINVEILPDLKILGISTDLPDFNFQNQEASLLPAIASSVMSDDLALSLIPEDVKMNKVLKKKAREITKAGILAMTALILLCAALLTNMFFKDLYLRKILSSYTKENQESQNLKDISDRTMIVKGFLNQKGKSLFVLSELFKAMPDEVYLNGISLKADDALNFTGTADSMSRVFSLVTSLENNKVFKNVKVDFTKSRRFKDKEVADFGLTLYIEEYLPYAKGT
jgi:hypothetical protein